MSQLDVQINASQTSVTVTDDCLFFTKDEVKTKIDYEDILGFDRNPTENGEIVTTNLVCIRQQENENKLEKMILKVTGENKELTRLYSLVKENLQKVKGRPKSVIVFINPITGSANSRAIFKDEIEPILIIADIRYEVVVSENPDHPKELATNFDFSPFDGLVILGGDGTINELVSGLIQRKQREFDLDINNSNTVLKTIDIPIAILPTGTGNGMVQIAHGCVDVLTSTLHLIKGRTKLFPVYGNFCDNRLIAYSVMQSAFGLFGDLMYSIDYHRWMKKLRYVFVPMWFFLFKTLRQIETILTFESTPTMEGDQRDASNLSKRKTETERKILTGLVVWPSSLLASIDKDPDKDCDNDGINVLLMEPMSRWQMIKYFYSMVRQAKEGQSYRGGQFYWWRKQEYPERTTDLGQIDCNDVNLRHVRSVRLEVQNSKSELDLMVNLDGEIYKLTSPEIYINLLPNAYRMFSSFNIQSKEPTSSQEDQG